MSIKIQNGKTCLLLVEGKSETEFFIQLGYHLQFTRDIPLQIMQYDGKDKLKEFLLLIQSHPAFLTMTHIGIIRDADFDGRAFADIQNALTYANSKNPDRPQFPTLTEPLAFTGTKPGVAAFIMPDSQSDGMLETLILQTLTDDDTGIMDCVDSYFACVEETGIAPKPEPLDKAKMRVYMTALYQGKMRAYIEGKHVDVETIGSDKDKSYLSDIYKMTWWDWNHSAFDDIKAFIRELVK